MGLEATHLELSIFPEDSIDEEELENIMDLLEEHGFQIADSYSTTILTTGFVSSEENINELESIQSKLNQRYPDCKVTYRESLSDKHPGSKFFPRIRMITVKCGSDESPVSSNTNDNKAYQEGGQSDRGLVTNIDWREFD